VRAVVVSSRPLSWLNTAFPFAAAYLLTAREIDLAWILGTVYFLIPYNLALYGINDVFDYESDLRNPRKGGIEGAVLGRQLHRVTITAVLVTNIPFLACLSVIGTPLSTLVLAFSVFAVIAYSVPGLRFKERPVVDSFTSSAHFVSPAIFGLALAGAEVTPALVVIVVAFFLWGVASHAFGAVQDIIPDRTAQIASIATVFGGRVTVRFAAIGYLLAGVGLFTLAPWPVALAGALAVPYAINALMYWSISDESAARVNVGWRRFLWLNYLTGFAVTVLSIWWWLDYS